MARFPLRFTHLLGALLGCSMYAVSPRFRRYHAANLRQAGYDGAGLRRVAAAETGKGVMELPTVWLRSHERSASLVHAVDGWGLVERAMAARAGLILLTPHLGCWEVSAQYFSRHYPLTVLYSRPKVAALEPLMREGRTRDRMHSVPADLSGVRALYRALRRGEAIGMLPDQVPGAGEGQWAEFFGRPAYTMTLAMRMAESVRCPVLMAYAERLPRGRGFRLHVDALPDGVEGETPARRMNRALEGLIRRSPSQYLWAYNRYKTPAGAAAEPA